jgi:hypothetical protein
VLVWVEAVSGYRKAHGRHDLAVFVANGSGGTAESDHRLLLVVGVALLAHSCEFLAQSCEAGNRVGCEGREPLALDDGLDFFPGARCKQHFADAAAMGIEASADAGEDDLESAVATELIDIEHLTVDEDGEMGGFPPTSDKFFHDPVSFKPEFTGVDQRLGKFEQHPSQAVATIATPLE